MSATKERPSTLTPAEARVALREAKRVIDAMETASKAITEMVEAEARLTMLGLGERPHSDFVSAVSKMRSGEGNPLGPMPTFGTLYHFKTGTQGLHELMAQAQEVIDTHEKQTPIHSQS